MKKIHDLLSREGYIYDSATETYVNKQKRRKITREYIEDASCDKVQDAIKGKVKGHIDKDGYEIITSDKV